MVGLERVEKSAEKMQTAEVRGLKASCVSEVESGSNIVEKMLLEMRKENLVPP